MSHPPRIILVGAGRFGKHHLRVLRAMDRRGEVHLAGIVVKRLSHARALAKETGLPVWTALSTRVLRQVDAVLIATPSATHAALVRRCLPFVHVFVEKPLAERPADARALTVFATKHGHTLTVGHVFRFHPLYTLLKKRLRGMRPPPVVTGRFVSPAATWRGEDAALEELHLFDVLDGLFANTPSSVWVAPGVRSRVPLFSAHLAYPNGIKATLRLGWEKGVKERTLTFQWLHESWACDFQRSTLTVTKRGRSHVITVPVPIEPLTAELSAWVRCVRGQTSHAVDGTVGARIVTIASACRPRRRSVRPRIAVIGGGLFGVTAALRLARTAHVTLFEAESDLLQGATRCNQNRHHMGYHYPRSTETIADIRQSTASFQRMYGNALMDPFPSYYAIARAGSRVSPQAFLRFCRAEHLPIVRAFPDERLLRRTSVSLCLQTPEGAYDDDRLARVVRQRIAASRTLAVRTGHRVVGATLAMDGRKILTIQHGRTRRTQAFDQVVNATYANTNRLNTWLGFPLRDLELRLKEIAVVRLPQVDPVAVTVMDGPFATLVPMGETGLFTLGDVPLSIRRVADGAQGTAVFGHAAATMRSRWPAMRRRCMQWFPILKEATYVRSFFITLPVDRAAAATDARPTEVMAHGFGCWSLLSGKIVTAVRAADELVARMRDA